MPSALDEYLKNSKPEQRADVQQATKTLQQHDVKSSKESAYDPQAPPPTNAKTNTSEQKLGEAAPSKEGFEQMREPNAVDRAQEKTAQSAAKEPAQELQKNDVSMEQDNDR